MLTVDPVKRISVPDITQHPFFTTNLPKYLIPLPPPPGPVLGTLTSLVTQPKTLDFEVIEGLGRIEENIVDDLASRMIGVDKDDIWEALRRDDGIQGNAVKVAYLLLRDKGRMGKDSEYILQSPAISTDVPQSRSSRSPNEMLSWLSWMYVLPVACIVCISNI